MKWFHENEFRRFDLLRPEMKDFLDELRERFGAPIIITSSYRDPEHNAQVGGTSNSSHCPALDGLYSGIDFTIAGGRITSFALNELIRLTFEIGLKRRGLYKDQRHMHIDCESHLPQNVTWIG